MGITLSMHNSRSGALTFDIARIILEWENLWNMIRKRDFSDIIIYTAIIFTYSEFLYFVRRSCAVRKISRRTHLAESLTVRRKHRRGCCVPLPTTYVPILRQRDRWDIRHNRVKVQEVGGIVWYGTWVESELTNEQFRGVRDGALDTPFTLSVRTRCAHKPRGNFGYNLIRIHVAEARMLQGQNRLFIPRARTPAVGFDFGVAFDRHRSRNSRNM